jgi:hypothetical protein
MRHLLLIVRMVRDEPALLGVSQDGVVRRCLEQKEGSANIYLTRLTENIPNEIVSAREQSSYFPRHRWCLTGMTYGTSRQRLWMAAAASAVASRTRA